MTAASKPSLLILSALLLGSLGVAAEADDQPLQRTITVTASGQVSRPPDIARISSGVTTEGESAKDAMSKNTAVMAQLLAGLKGAGVYEKDIQTSTFRVEPRYTNPREGQAPVIDGYRVTNQVSVVVRDLERLGEVLDQLVRTGANEMGGLTFEVSEAESLKDEARRNAVANAHRRAQLIAAAAGAEIGQVISIAEDATQYVPFGAPMARAMKAEAVPIEPGAETLEARVTVTWALR